MNERIKELVLEAGFVHYGEDQGFYNIPVPAFNSRMERFAESIVRECARLVEDSKWNSPRGCTAADQAKYVKEHFGVEL